jgi:dethiobiotin synthetase
MAPLSEGRNNLDLIEALDVPALFVAGSYLGAISHALTGLTCLDVRGVEIAAIIVSESAESVGLAETCALISAQRRGQRVVGAPRTNAQKPGESVSDWAAALGKALAPARGR